MQEAPGPFKLTALPAIDRKNILMNKAKVKRVNEEEKENLILQLLQFFPV
jgi:hypothetical protein